MKILYCCLCVATLASFAACAPASGFVFPDEVDRRQRKLEPIITPPVLPVIEHLERDPSTLLPSEMNAKRVPVKPRFGGGFNIGPSGSGGLTASISSSASGLGASHSASQSFSINSGFSEGFSASHSASQASSFNGFGSGFSGSQASSQAASFGGGGNSGSGVASSAAAFGGNQFGGGSGSQSASSAFGFNSLGSFQPESTFGDGLLDIRHRGAPNFPFPSFGGRSKGLGTSAFRSSKPGLSGDDDFFKSLSAAAFRSGKSGLSSDDDFISILVSD